MSVPKFDNPVICIIIMDNVMEILYNTNIHLPNTRYCYYITLLLLQAPMHIYISNISHPECLEVNFDGLARNRSFCQDFGETYKETT